MGIETYLAGAALVMSAAGTYLSYNAQKEQMQAQKNALAAEAARAEQAAQYEASQLDEATRRLMASQRARFAASGVAADFDDETSTVFAVLSDTAEQAAKEREAIISGATSYANSLTARAYATDAAASSYGTGSLLATSGTLLSGVSKIGDEAGWFNTSWYDQSGWDAGDIGA